MREKIVRYITPIAVGMVILILLVSYFILFKSKIEGIKAGGRLDASILENILQGEQERLAYLKNLEKDFRALDSESLKRLDMVIPQEIEISHLIVEFDQLATQHSLSLGSINIAKTPSAETGLKSFSITMDLQAGNYQLFKNFLKALEKHLPLFDITTIRFSLVGPSYSLNLKTYSL